MENEKTAKVLGGVLTHGKVGAKLILEPTGEGWAKDEVYLASTDQDTIDRKNIRRGDIVTVDEDFQPSRVLLNLRTGKERNIRLHLNQNFKQLRGHERPEALAF